MPGLCPQALQYTAASGHGTSEHIACNQLKWHLNENKKWAIIVISINRIDWIPWCPKLNIKLYDSKFKLNISTLRYLYFQSVDQVWLIFPSIIADKDTSDSRISQVANWKAWVSCFSFMLPEENSKVLHIDHACAQTTGSQHMHIGLFNTNCSVSYNTYGMNI